MTRNTGRRIERLETRVKASKQVPHTICFIDTNRLVVSTLSMATSKWTHFDPPRDRAEFEPIA